MENTVVKLYLGKNFDEFLDDYKNASGRSKAREDAVIGMSKTANTKGQWSELWGKTKADSKLEKKADRMMSETS